MRDPVRIAVSVDEAAAALSVSRDYFDAHIGPTIRLVRAGRRKLVPVSELQRWVDANATRAGKE